MNSCRKRSKTWIRPKHRKAILNRRIRSHICSLSFIYV